MTDTDYPYKESLYETGPLAIALNDDPLQIYSSGILDLTYTKCPSSGINHAVILVGYGTQAGENLDISELEEEMELAELTAISLLVLFHSKYFSNFFKKQFILFHCKIG